MDVILLQLTMWHYQQDVQHPALDVVRHSTDSFVGEDIELLNRLLSHHSKDNSRRSDPSLLNDAYQSLGYLVHSGMELNQDLLDSPRFIKGNRRYIVRSDSKEMKVFKVFMQTMYDDFKSGNYLHYSIPRTQAARKNLQNKWERVAINVKDYRTMKLLTAKTATRGSERKKRELISVGVLCAQDWVKFLGEKFGGLLRRSWQFQEHLSEETLADFKRDFPQYVGEDRPQRRERKKKRKER